MIKKNRTVLGKTAVHTFGYFAGWMILSGVLILGSRMLRLGHGFSNPWPYVAIAFVMAVAGRLLRKWLG